MRTRAKSRVLPDGNRARRECAPRRTLFCFCPAMNPDRKLITGVVCGVRVENIEEPLMQDIRYLDKMVDELAKGKSMEKILRNFRGND